MLGTSQSINKSVIEAFRRMKEKDFPGAESVLQEGLKKAESDNDKLQSAVYYSTLGVLSKVKGEFRDAWKYYEKAEKLMPDDPSLKIIMAKLLIDRFAQYETAIKKMKDVLRLAKGCASFEHQAHATMAIAYLKKGEKKKAVEMLDEAMVDDFVNVTSAENLNFEVIEAFLARNFEVDRCQKYVLKALDLARSRRELKPQQFLNKLLESFEVTIH